MKDELLLLLWDESVQEKAGSLKSEGLCAVRSSKGKRLLRIKPGYYEPPRQPWYLLTNEEVNNDGQAWKLVHAYARRWQIEQSYRFTKSELGMESCRLWFWENKMKLLQTVALMYAFMLTLLDQNLQDYIQSLLRQGCHRTGKRCRIAPTPLYRIRLALANLFNHLNLVPIQSSG